MNERQKLDFDTSSGTPSWSIKRNTKVNIREICEKFEKLSSNADDSNSSSLESSPVAPVRRKKVSGSQVSQNKILLGDEADNAHHYASVRKKSKIFEPADLPNTAAASENGAFKKNSNQCSALKISKSGNGFPVGHEKLKPTPKPPPPSKPPRSFVLPRGNASVSRKCSLPEIASVNEIISKFPPEPGVTRNPITSDTKYGEINKPGPRLNSAPEISVKVNSKLDSKMNSAPQISTKVNSKLDSKLNSAPEISTKVNSKLDSKMDGKSPNFLDRFRNLSSVVGNIQEKVSWVFVDLTPTTVSPPKHYGTLKKSMSDEHIYAEVSSVVESGANKSKEQAVESMHYMCSPVIPSSSFKPNATDRNISSKQSVRNIIYSSFAGLRGQTKDATENISSYGGSLESNESDVSQKAIQARIIYVKSVRKQISSSSMCLAPKLYEALLIINIEEGQPQVTYSFPLKISDEYKVPLLPHICFPSPSVKTNLSSYHSDTFHFTLTDKEETVFGYCLRIQGWPESRYVNESLCIKVPVAVCILSSFSAPVFYKKLLFEVEKHLNLPRNRFFKYIRSLQKLGVPNAGASLSIPDYSEKIEDEARVVITRPLDSHFVGLEMTRALQLLDVDILIKCVASLFLERRILFLSASTGNLYDCCKAISSLLYPFEWPHAVVPVLPACLTVQCCSDQPYIYGILNTNSESVLELLLEHELLIIDIDKGSVIKACNDEDTILPKKVQKAVLIALNLAKNMTDPTEMLRDIMISEAFVHMSVEMIGHYENHFVEQNGNTVFQKEAFLKHAYSYNIRSFLQWFSETQMFDTFIEESLWRIRYRSICQNNLRTFFEKRIDEYKWELNFGGDKISRLIGKTVRNFGEKLRNLKK